MKLYVIALVAGCTALAPVTAMADAGDVDASVEASVDADGSDADVGADVAADDAAADGVASEAGDDSGDAGGTAQTSTPIACDGALCDTTNGAQCGVPRSGPGSIKVGPWQGLAALSLALAAIRRGSGGRSR